MTFRTIIHRSDCTADPEPEEFTGISGDKLYRCPECRVYASTATAGPRQLSGVRSLYVCAEHLRPVTWRGTNCAECDAERRARQQSRERRRRERLQTAR